MDEIIFRVLLLGDSNVGKTSLMIRFTDNSFEENSASTIGIEFKNKEIELNEKKIKLNILDTAGQEKYLSVAKNFIRNGDGIIFTFDLTNEKSFKSIKNWLMTSEEVNQGFQKILVGNKFDLSDKKVNKETAEKFCEKYQMKYFEVSAKNGTNVELIFREIAQFILANKPEREINGKNAKLSYKKNNSQNSKDYCKTK